MTTPSLIIIVPSLDMIHAKFAISLMRLQKPADFALAWKLNCATGRARNELLENALASKAEHILILDSDMTFPADLYTRLARRVDRHQIGFCAAPYWTRNTPWTPAALRQAHGRRYVSAHPASFPEALSLGGQDVEPGLRIVHGIGVAAALLTRELAIKLHLQRPPIEGGVFARDPDDGVSFTWSMADAKEPIYVDTTISVGHCGIVEFDEHMAGVLRDATGVT